MMKEFEIRDACLRWREYIVICVAVLLAYASVWPNTFVYDDKALITGNALLKHWGDLPELLTSRNFAGYAHHVKGFYRPVPALLHFFIYQGFGPSTVAFHALNVFLHALNACLLLYLGIRMGFGKGAAFAAALLWAVHPLHTEAVTYMAATPELLWSTFCLFGLIVLLPDFTPRKMWLAAAFFLLALGCKESAVVFPALAAAMFFLVSNDRTRPSAYLKTWPLWLLAAGFIATWVVFMYRTGYSMDGSGNPAFFWDYTANMVNRIWTSLATLPAYVGMIIWPAGLYIERAFAVSLSPLDLRTVAGALMVGLCLVQILWGQARRGLALSFGILWFAAAQSPNTGIVLPIDALISEHWMYLPTMGLFLGVTQAVAGVFEKRQGAARFLVLVMALSLGAATFFQNQTWRDAEALYQNIRKNGGNLNRVSDHLGILYLSRHEFGKAVELFQYVLSFSDGRPATAWVSPHMNLAFAWLQAVPDKNDEITMEAVLRAIPTSPYLPEAISEFGKAVLADPDHPWPRAALAAVYRYQGNTAMADFHQKRVDELLQKRSRGERR